MAANKKHSPRAGRAPAYQWYPGDALADEAMSTMDLAEEGAFRRLLDHHYREGSIPADPEELRRLCKWIPVKRFEAIWKRVGKCFAPDPANPLRLKCPSVESRVAEELERQERAAAAGLAAARSMLPSQKADRARRGAAAMHLRRTAGSSNGVLYAFRCIAVDLIKVGFTGDLSRRRQELSRHLNAKGGLELLCSFAGTIADEQRLHGDLAKYRVDGEWYRQCDDVLALLADAARRSGERRSA